MKSTKIWIFIIGIVFLTSLTFSFIVFKTPAKGTIANIYEDGICINSIDLSNVTEGYEFTIETEHGANIISVEKNKISIIKADCSDQVCVNQGWISNSVTPIVCLPHKIAIKLEDIPKNIEREFDALSQ
ncbi:MAG: NusG domain II-containing protein [Clostridium perfringens]|nr:NusG domain II-containing protein [Clostridium perfringens]